MISPLLANIQLLDGKSQTHPAYSLLLFALNSQSNWRFFYREGIFRHWNLFILWMSTLLFYHLTKKPLRASSTFTHKTVLILTCESQILSDSWEKPLKWKRVTKTKRKKELQRTWKHYSEGENTSNMINIPNKVKNYNSKKQRQGFYCYVISISKAFRKAGINILLLKLSHIF